MDPRSKVSEFWGSSSGSWRLGNAARWLEHPLVQERINLKVVGAPGMDRYQHFLRRYLWERMPVERALTLGCGLGAFERGVAKYGLCSEHEAVDISEGAIRHAVEAAQTAGLDHLRYRVADLNTIELEPDRYDVVFGISSVHHVEKLERLFEQVSRALRPGGYFLLDEFIGPSRFQWTTSQLRVINEALVRLPSRLRRSRTRAGQLKHPVHRPSVAEVVAVDPSEAIRSDEITTLLPNYFEVEEICGYGGTVLHLLLDDIAGNFDEAENPGSMAHLRRLFRLEDELIDSGKLQHDFATIVARRRG